MAEQKIKCVVWDLDNSLWNGTLVEYTVTGLNDGVLEQIEYSSEISKVSFYDNTSNY